MQYVGAKHEILHFVQDDKSVKYFMLPVVITAESARFMIVDETS